MKEDQSMRRFLITAIVVLALPVAALVGCGSKDEPQVAGNGSQGTKESDASKVDNARVTAAKAIDWCIVSGEELGSMGDPVNYKYNGREITFCCKSCVKQFEANPTGYLARLDSALAGQIEAPSKHDGHSH
jgi:YHS domain-containing protein